MQRKRARLCMGWGVGGGRGAAKAPHLRGDVVPPARPRLPPRRRRGPPRPIPAPGRPAPPRPAPAPRGAAAGAAVPVPVPAALALAAKGVDLRGFQGFRVSGFCTGSRAWVEGSTGQRQVQCGSGVAGHVSRPTPAHTPPTPPGAFPS